MRMYEKLTKKFNKARKKIDPGAKPRSQVSWDSAVIPITISCESMLDVS